MFAMLMGAAALVLFAPAGPAVAGPDGTGVSEAVKADHHGCPEKYLCFWASPNYHDGPGMVKDDNEDFRKLPHISCRTGTWDNCISSVVNNGQRCTVYMWSGLNYGGSYHSLAIGNEKPDLSQWYFNDAISSNHWCTPK
ncbi:peptidase inhibitor family I36 protein [Krasilnikovia sp. MM14-A1259]|uniref:peptidase inhibitor family I36 protein n=1 Tax=Krasilnikovia sp. MM14-A1259 TaxID=3373539 RepID=UPI00399C8DF3